MGAPGARVGREYARVSAVVFRGGIDDDQRLSALHATRTNDSSCQLSQALIAPRAPLAGPGEALCD